MLREPRIAATREGRSRSRLVPENSVPHQLTRALRALVGDGGLITEPSRLIAYESDGLVAYRYLPRAVVLPTDTDQAAAVLARLHRDRIPFVPRGAGTGLSGGALATGEAVLVSTSRMNRIVALDPIARVARVQAGVVNADLSAAALPYGLQYAPDPSSQAACTLGGNVAENSGGPHCLKYGVTSRWVTGLTFVLPNGRVLELGGWGRDAPGYDLVGVVVGSEGCFGLVTEIEVRLTPIPEGVRTLLAIFDDLEAAGTAVTGIIASGLLPCALEIIDAETIRAVEASVFAAGYPTDAGAALVVEMDGTDAGLDAEADHAEACCRAAGASEVRRARSERERLTLWKGRKKAFGAMGRIAPDMLVQDATVPRTRLPNVLHQVGEIGRTYGLRIANVFHGGDGNLHPIILFDRRDPDEVARVDLASREIMRACVAAGGTITGEHGVGIDKREYMELVFSPTELQLMAAVEAVFDPLGLCNPEKVLPAGWRGSLPKRADQDRVRERGASVANPADPVAGLEGLLPHDRVRIGDAAAPWSAWGGSPPPVVLPRATEEAVAVILRANAEGWRVALAGSGTWLGSLDSGSPPDLVLSTAHMDRVLEYEPGDLTMTVEAGMRLSALDHRLARNRQWWPLDPPGRRRTLGAVVSTGVSGPTGAAWGGPRDLALGLSAVTGDGRAFRAGGRVVKNVAGFDLVRLLVGSCGTLAFVGDVTLRLFPRPAMDRTLVVRGACLEQLREAVSVAASHRVTPTAVELLECSRSNGHSREAILGVRLVGSAERVREERRLMREVLLGVDAGVVDELATRATEEFWREVRLLEEETDLALRLSAPREQTSKLIEAARSVGQMRDGRNALVGLPVSLAMSGGASALRVAVRDLCVESGAAEHWAEHLTGLRRTLAHYGGSLTVVRAPTGILRRLHKLAPPGPMGELMTGLKAVFDPAGILPAIHVPVDLPARNGGGLAKT